MNRSSLAILALLLAYPSTNALLFTPALPSIVSFFGLTPAQSDWTISIYLIGYAMGQLPYGPLANRFGRKRTLYVGLLISIIGSMLCALSSSFASFLLLVFARFLQALGACVGLKVSFTIIGDLYDETKGAKVISLLGISFALVPAMGLMIGGYLAKYFPWESCFYFLSFFGVAIMGLIRLLPETSKELNRDALQLPKIIDGYIDACKNKALMFSGLIVGLGTAISYVFNAQAAFVGVEHLKLSPDVYGRYSLIPLLGMLVGSVLSNRLAGNRYLMRLLLVGTAISMSVACFMLFLFANDLGTPVALFLPMFLIFMIDSVIFSNVSSLGIARAKNKANGSAILHFMSLSTAACFMFGIKFIHLPAIYLMPMSFIVLLGITFVLCFGLNRLKGSEDTEQFPSHELDQDQL